MQLNKPDKEAILNNELRIFMNTYRASTLADLQTFIIGFKVAYAAMDEYAASLLKENEELKLLYQTIIDEYKLNISGLQSTNEELKTSLAAFAKEMNVYIDFSDKSYDGDKNVPMDAIGFIQYIQSIIEKKEKECINLLNWLGEQDLKMYPEGWCQPGGSNGSYYSSEDLYFLFKQKINV